MGDNPYPEGIQICSVWVALPAHSRQAQPLRYTSEQPLAPGTLVRVPLGRRQVLGIVWDEPSEDAPASAQTLLRPVAQVLDALAPLDARWRRLVAFCARYYQRSVGEVALAALPPALRDMDAAGLARRLSRHARPITTWPQTADRNAEESDSLSLNEAQQSAVAAIGVAATTHLLYGVTGSGKTEVYLRAAAEALARDDQAQVLVLVPEINLTPQLERRFADRFGEDAVASLHSGLTPARRLGAWLDALSGRARVLLGTRMAVLTPLPGLRLIVVDEEHDPSYKQQEGARYSARDLAVWRGRHEGVAVVLGSATPSLESWAAAARGRYRRLDLPHRIGDAAALPEVRVLDMRGEPRGTVLAPALREALAQRLARGEQALVFLNRRGWAPVLTCSACDWKSGCPHCSAWRVFHRADRTLRCHHCGHTERVPRACPECGNLDLLPTGRGTEQIEDLLLQALADLPTAHGGPPRVARLDADSTRGAGRLAQALARVHDGEVDVLVGTQLVTKGHDFRRVTLVAALDADGALFSADFRAPERLFALLLQAAGRAGRDARLAGHSQMWVQTRNPGHPLFAALRRHDFAAFAAQQLAEREAAGLPPFGHQALLRAEARDQAAAQDFLRAARTAGLALPEAAGVTLYPPVPMAMPRVANVERAQLLLESGSRPTLQRFLTHWQPLLHGLRPRGLMRWAIDVDPLAI